MLNNLGPKKAHVPECMHWKFLDIYKKFEWYLEKKKSRIEGRKLSPSAERLPFCSQNRLCVTSGQTLKKKKQKQAERRTVIYKTISKADTITLKMLQQIQKYAKIAKAFKQNFITEKSHTTKLLGQSCRFQQCKRSLAKAVIYTWGFGRVLLRSVIHLDLL